MADGGAGLQDDELYLPRTVVNKLIKEIVPNIRVASDARDLLLNCCTEFIHLLASEASDISEKQQKKVISPEHVVEALVTLGFQEYIADVKAVHKEYKEQATKHRKRGKSKLDRLGIPEEELLRQQQQLFEEARQQQMETELLEQQRSLQQQQPPQAPTTDTPPPPESVSPPTQSAPLVGVSQMSGGVVSDGSVTQQQPGSSANIKLPAGSPLLPQSAAITVASLQATSSLLQQALAMASAQMAANNSAQQQQQQLAASSATSSQPPPPQQPQQQVSPVPLASAAALQLPHTLLLQQQQALAVLAAQQAQMGSQLNTQLQQQSVAPQVTATTTPVPLPLLQSTSSSSQGSVVAASGETTEGQDLVQNVVVPPQEVPHDGGSSGVVAIGMDSSIDDSQNSGGDGT